MSARLFVAAALAAAAFLVSCAVRPDGENAEREHADRAGEGYAKPIEERDLPSLGPESTLEDYVRHSLLANGELERSFFEWRAALERIPQEASQPTTPMFGFEHAFSTAESAWDSTTLFVNSGMENLVWPGKLAAAGRAALEEAKAAGLRFDRAKLRQRSEVVAAYVDLALLDEEVSIQSRNVDVLELVAVAADARVRSGTAPQQDLLKTRTELDLAKNDLLTLRSRRPGLAAAFHALVGEGHTDLEVRPKMPEGGPLPFGDAEVLMRVATRNPELAALAHEAAGRGEALEAARQAWYPEVSLTGGIVGSVSQFVGAAFMLPVLRREAIAGRIAEVEARLAAISAARRQAKNDFAARAVLELYALRNAEREVELFKQVVIPRAAQTIDLSRAAYGAGQVALSELLDSQRLWLGTRLELARLRAEREKSLASLEALTGVHLTGQELDRPKDE